MTLFVTGFDKSRLSHTQWQGYFTTTWFLHQWTNNPCVYHCHCFPDLLFLGLVSWDCLTCSSGLQMAVARKYWVLPCVEVDTAKRSYLRPIWVLNVTNSNQFDGQAFWPVVWQFSAWWVLVYSHDMINWKTSYNYGLAEKGTQAAPCILKIYCILYFKIIFLCIYKCAWKLAFLKSSHIDDSYWFVKFFWRQNFLAYSAYLIMLVYKRLLTITLTWKSSVLSQITIKKSICSSM